ncbi:MAG: hypothetical protein QOH04_2611 [Sphingomonadales bacterium]|jgi:hypothetical protein|nr:hypothetical protein [Sphingomonadales bacterium]
MSMHLPFADAGGARGLPFEGPVLSEVEGCQECGVDPCACARFAGLEEAAAAALAPPASIRAGMFDPRASERLLAWRSPALAAFLDRRAELEAKHGDKAATAPGRDAAAMARDLHERSLALLDRLRGHGGDRFALALNTLASVGALALALHEKLLVSIADGAGEGEEA